VLGPLPLTELTAEVLRGWKAALSEQYAKNTVHKYMSFFSRALNYAVDCEWLAVNPLAKIRKPSPGQHRIRFLLDIERTRLLMACKMSRNPILYPLVVLALTTGGRKQELLKLHWSEVDLDAGTVRFIKTKTYLDRTVSVVGEGAALLHTLASKRRTGIPWVFARPDGKKPRAMECAWTTARRIAELSDFRFHDLRHTYASYLAMSGASLRDIAEVLGHKKIQQTMQYAHLIPGYTRPLVEQMVGQFLSHDVV
jgi:integrase